jgi:PKD repeat protein
VTHTYTAAGTYTAILVVNNTNGQSGNAVREITVTAPPVEPTPTCSLGVSTSSGQAPLTVTFTPSGNAQGGTIQGWALSFGDGAQLPAASGAPSGSFTHTYAAAGTYTAILVVSNTNGKSCNSTRDITVSSAPTQKFVIGDRVQVHDTGSGGLMVYSSPCATRLYPNRYDGTTGQVLEGPVLCAGYNRWRVQWSDGVVGWSAEDWLRIG